MLLFCPACQSAFTGVTRCPRCSGLLLLPEEVPSSLDEAEREAAPILHRSSSASRVVFGTLTALTLYLGLRKLVIGWAMATSGSLHDWWQTATGLATVFALQGLAAVFGALLTAAGRPHGVALGAAVGGLCGGLFLAAELASDIPGGQLVLVLQPLVLILVGGIAGRAGARIWPAAPHVEMPAPVVKRSSSIQLGTDTPKDAARPTDWVRVMIAASMMFVGIMLAEQARTGAEKLSAGILRVETRGQGKFLSCQIAFLAVLGGGAFAGAGTGAGFRHGMLAGLIGAAGVVGMTVFQGQLAPPAEYLLERIDSGPVGPQVLASLAELGMMVAAAGVIGGWFGGQLFLPLAPAHMRTRRLDPGPQVFAE